ncbi:hypothetical protein GWC77_06295 [Paraburkholderia sp. NMBU_R16]|uniref:hypothetical protein n=1 Tax=Paraburkholderia sp. NMBU_R16 TaxID=2698676 RepID=UPI00156319B9|nr:hypothetical protein [Paraburkholderia sp. NMBU_R16]NRO95547.1 hypothetical protein [Paraburkholderia sp. NMBU_R16]
MAKSLGEPETVADVKDRTIRTDRGDLTIRVYHPARAKSGLISAVSRKTGS